LKKQKSGVGERSPPHPRGTRNALAPWVQKSVTSKWNLIDGSDLRPFTGRRLLFHSFPGVSASRLHPPAHGFDPFGITIAGVCLG
jgi:hypothetical protein